MPAIKDSRIIILATNGFEQSELEVPLNELRKAGARVDVVSLKEGEITGWDKNDWGTAVKVDHTIADARVTAYDALVLPGGQINPDLLRVEDDAVAFIREFHASGKPVAAICHAPWLLIEAGLMRGRRATSYHSIHTDMENAGAIWEDKPCVRDGNMITSRKPDDLGAFVKAIIDAVEENASARVAAE
ncbi:type 1 glutamine amidotransferase domain-containing protein [Mesorhizobium sp. CAU 1741]|uniref:type 1 glutamine amidotransferase domain-containing protein n=1 Tax=Mesorhizobium sp. CAU 1741 TaxID=3140366 RepID=UPI00325AD66E